MATSIQDLMKEAADMLEQASSNWLQLEAAPATDDETLPPATPETSANDEIYSQLYAVDVNSTNRVACDIETSCANSATSSSALLHTLSTCAQQVSECSSHVNEVGDKIKDLHVKYDEVSGKTSSLHESCDQLMADQTRLASLSEEIRSRLAYYEPVDNIMQKLNSSRLSVTSEAFTRMLAQIDECMYFMRQQPDCKESSTYYSRYHQCLSRALSLVKSFVGQKLHESTEAVQKQLSAEQMDREDAFTLYYGVFATHAQTISALTSIIEAKLNTHDEYASVLADCHSLYLSQRDVLMTQSVRATIQALQKQHANSTCSLTRAGCNALLRVCEDEYRLFVQFFSRPADALHEFLERQCQLLYDALRPTIIHVAHLETLAEVCAIIKIEIIENRCTDIDVLDEYIGFVRCAQALVGDISERLVYRALMYAQADIAGYKPVPGDLAYPEKLLMMQEIAAENSQQQSSESGQPQQKASAVDLHALWYPTVRRTVLCLSKIYRCLHEQVFVGVSQEVLCQCVQSLIAAADAIAANSKKQLDAQLFLIKHLLILREQTSPFRVSGQAALKDTQLDFGKLKDSARSLMSDRSHWFALSSSNAFLEFLFQIPMNVTEHVADGRRTVDLQLRESCQKLILYSSALATADLTDYIRKADVVLEMQRANAQSEAAQLRQQPFATPQAVQDLVARSFKQLRSHLPALYTALQLYIANAETENILLQPIKKRVFECYAQARFIVSSNYTEEDQQIIALPTNEQLSITFANVKSNP